MTKIIQRKNSILILIFAAIATFTVAVVSYSFFSYSFSRQEIGIDNKFEIVRITMISQHTKQKIVLENDNTGIWQLNQQYMADESAVEEVKQTLYRMQIKRPVKASLQQKINNELNTKGIKTSIYIKAYLINLGDVKLLPYTRKHQTFVAGDNTDDNTGTYIKNASSDKLYQAYIPGVERGISSLFNTNVKLWKNPVIIDVKKEKIESVTMHFLFNPKESYVLKRDENNEFSFFSFEKTHQKMEIDTDTNKTERFLQSFENVRYESLMDDALEKERKELMITEPVVKLSVTKTDGTSKHLTIFERKNLDEKLFKLGGITTDPDRFYIQLENGDFVVAQFYVFNRIIRPLSFFQNN